jgi:hypothetical protein
MPDELRMEKLAQWQGKRIKLRGTLGGWRPWSESYGRENLNRAVLKNVEVDGEFVANYLSVIRGEPLKDLEPEQGDVVELTALVRSYRNKDGETDYCVHNPADARLVNAPARLIPNGVPLAAPAPVSAPPPPPPPAAPPPPTPTRDPYAAIRPGRAFLKATEPELHLDPERAALVLRAAAALLECTGGPEEALKVLRALQED